MYEYLRKTSIFYLVTRLRMSKGRLYFFKVSIYFLLVIMTNHFFDITIIKLLEYIVVGTCIIFFLIFIVINYLCAFSCFLTEASFFWGGKFESRLTSLRGLSFEFSGSGFRFDAPGFDSSGFDEAGGEGGFRNTSKSVSLNNSLRSEAASRRVSAGATAMTTPSMLKR